MIKMIIKNIYKIKQKIFGIKNYMNLIIKTKKSKIGIHKTEKQIKRLFLQLYGISFCQNIKNSYLIKKYKENN